MTLDCKEWADQKKQETLDFVERVDRSYPDQIAAEVVQNTLNGGGLP